MKNLLLSFFKRAEKERQPPPFSIDSKGIRRLFGKFRPELVPHGREEEGRRQASPATFRTKRNHERNLGWRVAEKWQGMEGRLTRGCTGCRTQDPGGKHLFVALGFGGEVARSRKGSFFRDTSR